VLLAPSGRTIARTEQTLWAALAAAGTLTKTEGERNTVLKRFGGAPQRVLGVKIEDVLGALL
jgi:hypothetical protein